MTRLATTPDEMLTGIMSGLTPDLASRIVKPHLFCFGGLTETVGWIKAVRDGHFAMGVDGEKFDLCA